MTKIDNKSSSDKEKEADLALLKKVQAAREAADRLTEQSKKGRIGFLKGLTDIFMNAAGSIAHGITNTYHTIERNAKNIAFLRAVFNAAAPVTRPLGNAVRWAGGKVSDYYNFARTEREGEGLKLKWGVLPYYDKGTIKRDADGDPSYSVRRLGRVLGYTAVAALAGVLAVQAAYFYGTQFNEYIYTTGKDPITTETRNHFAFTACSTQPCSTDSDTGKMFNVEASLYLPTLLFPDSEVYANLSKNDGVCHIEGYGVYFRPLRFVHKSLDWWQNVYNVSCRVLTEQDQIDAIKFNKSPEEIFHRHDPQVSHVSQNQVEPPATAVIPGPG